jgi:hypothetical protein
MGRAIGRTIRVMQSEWKGDNAKIALARWFLSRCRKRDRKVKLERASRKRNRRH